MPNSLVKFIRQPDGHFKVFSYVGKLEFAFDFPTAFLTAPKEHVLDHIQQKTYGVRDESLQADHPNIFATESITQFYGPIQLACIFAMYEKLWDGNFVDALSIIIPYNPVTRTHTSGLKIIYGDVMDHSPEVIGMDSAAVPSADLA